MNRAIKEITKYDPKTNTYWFNSGHVAQFNEFRKDWIIGLHDWGNMILCPGGKRHTAAVKKIKRHQEMLNYENYNKKN